MNFVYIKTCMWLFSFYIFKNQHRGFGILYVDGNISYQFSKNKAYYINRIIEKSTSNALIYQY